MKTEKYRPIKINNAARERERIYTLMSTVNLFQCNGESVKPYITNI